MNEPAPIPADHAVVRTIEHADPSPVPENNWLWRRVFVFACTAVFCAHIWWLSSRTDDVQTLRETIRNDQGLIFLYALLYLAGASAEAIGRIVAAIRTSRKETVTQAPPPARITTPEATVTTPPGTSARLAEPRPPWERQP
jgi:hypothetical protein